MLSFVIPNIDALGAGGARVINMMEVTFASGQKLPPYLWPLYLGLSLGADIADGGWDVALVPEADLTQLRSSEQPILSMIGMING